MWNVLRLAGLLYPQRLGGQARLLAVILLIASVLVPLERAHAAALSSCTAPNVSLTVTPTADILVPGQVGSVVYRGTFTIDRTCDIAAAINTFNNIVVGTNIGSNSTVKGSGGWLGIRVVSQSSSISPAGGGCARNEKNQTKGTSHSYVYMDFVGSTLGARCTVGYSFVFEIYVKQLAGAAVVPFPYADPTGTHTLNSTPGWLVWEDNGTTTAYNLPSIAFNFNPVGCTLSANNIVVNLAAASANDLDAAGKTAQPQAFNIVLTGCVGLGSPYAAVATWSFTTLGGNSSVVANSAVSGAATNVGIQLLDGNSNPITDTGTSTLVSISASGTYSSTHYARYYAVGAATGGTVQSVATFNVTYQ